MRRFQLGRQNGSCADGSDGAALAHSCARNIFETVDRREPEAAALARWLEENAAAFGYPDTMIPVDGGGRPSRARGVCVENWEKIGAALSAGDDWFSDTKTIARQWVEAIARALELDVLALRMFELVVQYNLDMRVERLFDEVSRARGGPGRMHREAGLFALLLRARAADIASRFTAGGKLLDSGLLKIGRHGELDILGQLLSLIRRDVPPASDIYDQLLGCMETSALPWDAFAHLGRPADVAASVLRAAVAGRESGVNILLYGPPGTGKTSFAGTLATHIGARLRPVAEADDNGGEPVRGERLSGLLLAQRLAAPGGTVLLFDEAEDLFVRRGRHSDEENEGGSRVFIHRLLERGAVPVIWTANHIDALGPAVLRRMTMCLELKVPTVATRTMLWRRMGEAEGLALRDDDAARLARLVPAAPAVASAALRATRLAGGDAETARTIVEGVARAVGGCLPPPEKEPDALFDPALAHADQDLIALADDVCRPGAPRAISFLLSGPPGAGKSEWARYLAGRMGMPVLQKRTSDLLDRFVGGTEQNIASAFEEAREAQAFLVFDEADSLLLDRAQAVRSWEISQVNEMLTWMETHALPFACTTNLEDRLDSASLRRFLIHVRFGWLTAAQARLAFRRFFGMAAPAGLDGLRTLTPADFALARRRVAVRGGVMDAAGFLRELAAGSEGRVGGRGPLGFGLAAA